MNNEDFNHYFNDITFYIDYILFVILLIVEGFVFHKLEFKIDKSGKVTLLLHLIVSIVRVISTSLMPDFRSLLFITSNLIWISLHYFTFEMWLIKITLESQTFEAQLKMQNKVKFLKVLDVSIMFLIMFLFAFQNYVITTDYAKQFFQNN